MYPVTPPFKLYTGTDGKPLNAGYIYIGTANLDPVTHPIQVYWDFAGTIPAVQPIRTLNGYPSRAGTPTNFYVVSDASVTVKDSAGALVYTVPVSTDLQLASAILQQAEGASTIGIADAGGYYTGVDVEAALQEAAAPGFTTLARLAQEVANRLVPTGAVVDWTSATAATGWALMVGRSIGNASSSATERANADCEALFIHLHLNFADAQCAVSGGRSGSGAGPAAADFAAGKRLTLPDTRGRASAGLDINNGGGVAGRLTAAGGVVSATIGASGGVEVVTLSAPQMPVHTHAATDAGHVHSLPDHTHGYTKFNTSLSAAAGAAANVMISDATATPQSLGVNSLPISVGSGTASISNATAGGTAGLTQPHSSTQPTIIFAKQIKL